MYRLKHANLVPIRPSIIKTGFPEQNHMIPNIAIISSNNSDPLHLNAIILREALLNSPEEVSKLLGLKVFDILNSSVPKSTTKAEPKKQDVKKSHTSSEQSKEVDEWV